MLMAANGIGVSGGGWGIITDYITDALARMTMEKSSTQCVSSRQRLSSLIFSPENFIVGGSLASKQKAKNVEQDRKEFSAHLYAHA